jgi:hypothetical protein
MSIKKGNEAVDMWEKLKLRLKSLHTLLMILMTLGYLLATHLSTINSLEMALASKAERSEVARLDKKLTRIEVMLEEALMTKQELTTFREFINRKVMDIILELRGGQEGESYDGK